MEYRIKAENLVLNSHTRLLDLSDAVFFVFDVESVGLHGEGFAVGFVIVQSDGRVLRHGLMSCPSRKVRGTNDDRAWINQHVDPVVGGETHNNKEQLRKEFWREWKRAKLLFPKLYAVADCLWPVEANFFCATIKQHGPDANWDGPYPFIDVGSVLLAAGIDPLTKFDRQPSNELPVHNPLADACQSARIFLSALKTLKEIGVNHENRTQFGQ